DDLFEKFLDRRVISRPMADVLRRMKGMRNILVHEYGRVDNALVFETVAQRLDDFDDAGTHQQLRDRPGRAFVREILEHLNRGERLRQRAASIRASGRDRTRARLARAEQPARAAWSPRRSGPRNGHLPADRPPSSEAAH